MRHTFDNSQPDPDPEYPAIQNHRHPRMHPQMTALLHSFPGMADKLSMWPDDVLANDVLLWTHQTGSHGERLVIQFLLSVWDPGVDWKAKGFANFNLAEAIQTWPPQSRNAQVVARWMAAPFFP